MAGKIHTDLALEARELWQESAGKTSELPGVRAQERAHGGCRITTVEVLNEAGAKALNKPMGTYVTLELDSLLRRSSNAFVDAAGELAQVLSDLGKFQSDTLILAAGLGNAAITPDAVGPLAMDYILVTRHLRAQMPEAFGDFRPVAALRPGVLGTTGMESADFIAAIVRALSPACLLVVDALASRQLNRLCRTIQVTDTGIVPGSGVGNHRAGLTAERLGIPVIAIGVPTVVSAATIAGELLTQLGQEPPDFSSLQSEENLIVTPRDIDKSVRDMGKLIGYGINLALQPQLTVADIDMFLS